MSARIRMVMWLFLLILSLSPTTRLAAHHSGTMFEEKKTVTLEGVVREF